MTSSCQLMQNRVCSQSFNCFLCTCRSGTLCQNILYLRSLKTFLSKQKFLLAHLPIYCETRSKLLASHVRPNRGQNYHEDKSSKSRLLKAVQVKGKISRFCWKKLSPILLKNPPQRKLMGNINALQTHRWIPIISLYFQLHVAQSKWITFQT